MRIFWGIIAIAAGGYLVMKSEWVLNNMGRLDFFESKLHTMGGSRFGYKLIGLVIILIGIMMVANLTEGFVEWMASFFMPGDMI